MRNDPAPGPQSALVTQETVRRDTNTERDSQPELESKGLGFALVRCSFRVCGRRHRNRQRSYAGSIVVLLKWSRKTFRGMRFLQVSERRPCLRIAFNSAECFCDRRQGHGKSVYDCKEIPFKEADCN